MEGLAVMGFVFGMVGVVALVRLEKLTKTLKQKGILEEDYKDCLLYTSPSPRDATLSRMPSSA